MDELKWWQRGIVYQIYPRSFQDTNGDGVGDLAGIAARLDHVVALGADAIWLSPIFPSPMADFGYDVADYVGVDPTFGTLADFDALAAAARERGLKIILDFVPNHTSDRHPWFQEARSSKHNAKRDWYIFRDPAPEGGPPNNWISNFGGPAWTLDEATGQYYYHAFLREQPDLNWRNPEVVAAMHDVLRFWMNRGVDGFRVDVIWHLMKDPSFTDNPVNPDYVAGAPEIGRLLQTYSTDQPDIHETVGAMRRVVDEFDQRVLIGEIYLPIDRLVTYYGAPVPAAAGAAATEGMGAHLPFNFHLITTEWRAEAIARLVMEYEAALPAHGWPNWVLGNHDQKRIAARIGERQARVAAMLLLTLRGTPTLYYGDELGMPDVAVPPERVRDPWGHNEPGHGRDGARTPMQWDSSPNAGFSSCEPWLPVADDFASRNVEAQRQDPGSMLALYRRLIGERRQSPALTAGSWKLIKARGNLLAYERIHGEERVVVALNLGPDPIWCELPGVNGAVVLVSTREDSDPVLDGDLELRGHEGVVLRAH